MAKFKNSGNKPLKIFLGLTMLMLFLGIGVAVVGVQYQTSTQSEAAKKRNKNKPNNPIQSEAANSNPFVFSKPPVSGLASNTKPCQVSLVVQVHNRSLKNRTVNYRVEVTTSDGTPILLTDANNNKVFAVDRQTKVLLGRKKNIGATVSSDEFRAGQMYNPKITITNFQPTSNRPVERTWQGFSLPASCG